MIGGERRVLGVVEGCLQPVGRVVTGLAGGRKELRLCRVSRITGGVVVGLMTSDAIGRERCVVVVDVAIGTQARGNGVHAGEGERGVVVIEDAVGPEIRVVAQLARRGKASRDVIHRTERSVVIGLMASDAGCAVQFVVAVNVAVGALARRNGVHSGKGKPGCRMVESSVGPQHRIVTLLAGLGEARLRMVGSRCGLIILEVTAHAGIGRQVVIVVDVAVRTQPRGHCMRTRQHEAGGGVIESCSQPGSRVVTLVASLGKVLSHVTWIGCGLIILQVTRHARGAGQVVIIVDMAVGTLPRGYGMHPGKRESDQVVVETRIRP